MSVEWCSGKTKAGNRCGNKGEPNRGDLYFCYHHLLCDGVKAGGVQCGARAKYDGYCSAAHHPRFNHYKPGRFREEFKIDRDQLLKKYNFMDEFTEEPLDKGGIQRDHILECQIPAHIFNLLCKRKDESGRRTREISDVIPIVKEFVNDQDNLVPTHHDVNILKGNGVRSFLDERTFNGDNARWTTQLINTYVPNNKATKRLSRKVTKNITTRLTTQLKRLEFKMNDETDNQTAEDVREGINKLRIRIELT